MVLREYLLRVCRIPATIQRRLPDARRFSRFAKQYMSVSDGQTDRRVSSASYSATHVLRMRRAVKE